jgi:hypothetical protein
MTFLGSLGESAENSPRAYFIPFGFAVTPPHLSYLCDCSSANAAHPCLTQSNEPTPLHPCKYGSE